MKKLCVCCAAAVLLTHFASAADNYSQWTYYRNVVLNTKATGAGVTKPVLRFPVLVRLSAADSLVFRNAQANGQDIRFSKYDGTHFRYQIEQWNATAMSAAIWVLADSVLGNDSSAYMKMYWGNASAADSGNAPAVFDTANGFAAVYHLGEAAGNATDATSDAQAATPSGHTGELAAGMIGNAQSFGGSNDYYNVGAGAPFNMSVNNTFTLSAWVNHLANGNNAVEDIVSKFFYNAGNYRCYELTYDHSNTYFTFHISSDGTQANETIVYSATGIANNTWYFLTGALDGANMRLYINGAQVASAAKTGVYNSANSPFEIAAGSDVNKDFDGIIDEVAVSKVARDSNWVKLCYQNQRGAPLPPQTLVTLGPILANLAIISQPQSQWVAAGANASFTVAAMGISPISYRWITATDTVGTASTLTLTAVQAAADNSVYRCLVTNPFASVMSNPCTLHVATAPVITSQPVSQTVLAGSNASFSVTAVGVAPLSYKWVLSPYNTAADTVGTAATLALASVQASADQSIYKCVVGNSAGSAVSNPCTLHVVIVPPPPAVVSPAPNAVVHADSVVFRWNKSGNGTTGYLLQIAVDSAMANMMYADSSITDTTAKVYFSFTTQPYWFRMKAYNSAGWSAFSPLQKFTITTTSALPGAQAALSFAVSVEGKDLRYSLPRAGNVSVKLYDLSGRVVAVPVKGTQGAGSYRAPLGKITAGAYVMTFEAEGFALRKAIVIP